MRKSNRGFTLIEVIVAITIFTTAIGLGYKLMTSTSVVTNNQLKVFTEQQAANLVNKYITSDLEKSKGFTDADTTSNPYKYVIKAIIDENLEEIEYEVSVNKEKSTYSVSRKLKGSSIEIISNQPIKGTEPPFLIEPKEGFDNKYEVKLNGQNKSGDIKKYVFEVSSRLVGSVGSSNLGEGTTGGTTDNKDENIIAKNDYIDGQIRIERKGNNCSIGVYLLEYKENKYVGEPIQLGFKEDIDVKEMETMNITVDIPIKEREVIELNVNIDNTSIYKETHTYNGLSNKLINDRIEVYCENKTKINELKIGSCKVSSLDESWDGNKYSYILAEKEEQNNNIIRLECTLNGEIKKWSPFVINFGKYNEK